MPSGQVSPETAAQKFLRDAATKSADLVHREIIRKNMDSYDAAHQRGRSRIKDWEAARRKCQEIKREAIEHLDKYLLQFEEKVIAHGGHVFWAANGDEACAYIKDLAVSRGVRTVVKSKSMVTEEIHLSPVLEQVGIKVWETDLGEFIVQLRNEPPYHIVTPAMHLDRQQIRDLFREKLGEDIADADPQKLVALARRKGAHEIVQITQVKDPVEAVRELSPSKRGADVVIEAVGRTEAWEWAVNMVRKGGTVNFFGGCATGTKVQLDTTRLHYSEITLKATFHHTPETVRRAFGLITEKKVRGTDYITGEAPLSRLHDVLRHMLNRNGDIKTAIIPGH
jgi:cobalamin biosynthesis Mg chelatase CobN